MSSHPAPVRSVLAAVKDTAAAATAQDAGAFAAGRAALAEQDQELLRLLAGHALRTALEERHPDGLDGDEARDVLAAATKAGLAWLPNVDVEALILALTGALGMQDPDQDPRMTTATVTAHALLLLEPLGVTPPALARYLDGAVAELARAQTQEMP